MVTEPVEWPLWFVKGWTEATIEYGSNPLVRSGQASIIFCTSLPAALPVEQVDQFKDGVRFVLGADVQFLIESM